MEEEENNVACNNVKRFGSVSFFGKMFFSSAKPTRSIFPLTPFRVLLQSLNSLCSEDSVEISESAPVSPSFDINAYFAHLSASMGGPEGLSTTPTTVQLHHISVRYTRSFRTKAFPTVWESVADPMKGLVRWTMGGLKSKRCSQSWISEENGMEDTTTRSTRGKVTATIRKISNNNSSFYRMARGARGKSGGKQTVTALQEISTVLEPSEMHLVLGGAKAGKTSLLQVGEQERSEMSFEKSHSPIK